jgi:nitroreductase
MNHLKSLNWRYAAKSFVERNVPHETIANILEATRLSVSSVGLQPYQIFVIENKDLQKKIQEVAMNQQVVGSASHLLVFATWSELTEERKQNYISGLGATGRPAENWFTYVQSLKEKLGEEGFFYWMQAQTHIAFSFALYAAALEGVDSTPIEGFLPTEVDRILDLKSQSLKSSLLLPLGYRDRENDWNTDKPKYRRTYDELFTHLK